jgi:tRNA (adenine37-N6)-methyltransferase
MTNETQTPAERFTLHPVGHVRGGRAEPIDDGWDAVTAAIELTPEFGPEALAGLDGFSHVEVVFLFNRVAESSVVAGARHPRGRTDWPKVGIFAQRGKDRPNRLGVTICRLLAVEGATLRVAGLDAIDGTPVLDLKPVMSGFLPREAVREPDWARELMLGYWR